MESQKFKYVFTLNKKIKHCKDCPLCCYDEMEIPYCSELDCEIAKVEYNILDDHNSMIIEFEYMGILQNCPLRYLEDDDFVKRLGSKEKQVDLAKVYIKELDKVYGIDHEERK